ncbi:hypothetical protein ACFSKN_10315 [Mariniflexile gromovii]|uniref:hypothetical protein n=1 Tax=Mariniflexile gromovii TaxID=362523 RepID=UPI001FD7BB4C|nr:hypothetical protein [Mariniflexile gromovii]
MDEKQLVELLRYSSPKELYVVTYKNKLKLLVCPFEVLVKYDIESLKKHQIVKVDEVKITLELVTVYIIKGRAYFYFHFEIIVLD